MSDSDTTDDSAVFAVIEDRYGAPQLPDSIWNNRQGAIDRARELADGAEFKERGDGWNHEGCAQKGPSGYLVFQFEIQDD